MMKSVAIEDAQEGMILAEDLIHNSSVIVPRDTVLKDSHLKRLKKFEITDVMVRDTEGEALAEEKLKTAPKSVQGLGKRMYRKADYICLQGDVSEELYILVDGELDVIFTDPDELAQNLDPVDKVPIIEKWGKKISVIKGKMINFGELGAILGERRTATISARTDCVIARIPAKGDSFNNTIMRNPKLGLNISITIAKRLKDINVYIAKYNNVLSQVDHMVREFSIIYVTVAGKILKHVIATKDKHLERIHEEFKKSPLYNRLIKYKKQAIDSASITSSGEEIDEDSEIFQYGQVVEKKAGEIICYHGEVGDRMFVLMSGKLGVYVGDKLVANYNARGEVIGEISVLLGYASKGKGYDKRTATVKAISRCRLVSIHADELDDVVSNNPALILHITRKLADRLSSCNTVFIQAQNDVEEYMAKLSIQNGSCGAEIDRVLQLFMENVNLIEVCSAEVKVLKKMHEAIESKYSVLSERLGSISF